ncbi:hypothetical protein XC00_00015 [Acinetobacter baumannii]|nr:hypothetical protein [Acinetobacter baumannii]
MAFDFFFLGFAFFFTFSGLASAFVEVFLPDFLLYELGLPFSFFLRTGFSPSVDTDGLPKTSSVACVLVLVVRGARLRTTRPA